MRYTARAALAVALLIGFYLVVLGAFAALVALAAFVIVTDAGLARLVQAGLVLLLFSVAVWRGLRRRRGDDEPAGLLVAEGDQPPLWSEVRQLAAAVRTRPPDEIRLVPEVNAAVAEDSRFLGLLPGRRRMYLGVPLLQALSAAELRSVLAHELGHYSGKHTALGAVTYRGKEAIGQVIHELGRGSFVGWLLRLYGRFYLAVTHSVARRQELEADDFSVALAGSAAAASALRTLPPLDAAWHHFLESYASIGQQQGRRPAPLFEGFAAMLADDGFLRQLAELDDPAEQRSVYDTHPPLTQRLARIEATEVPPPSDVAADLIVRPGATFAALEEQLFAGSPLQASDWNEVVAASTAAGVASSRRRLGEIAGSQATLDSVLNRLQGRGAVGLLKGYPTEHERRILAGLLADSAADVVIRRAEATFRINWGGPPHLVDEDGCHLDPWSATAALAEMADSGPFRDWAAAHDVDLHTPLAVPTEEVTEPRVPGAEYLLAAICPVLTPRWKVLLITGQGLAVVSVGTAGSFSLMFNRAVSTTAYERASATILNRVLAAPLRDIVTARGTTLLDWSDIASARVRDATRFGLAAIELKLHDGRKRRLRLDGVPAVVGAPMEVMRKHLGERFSTPG